MSKLTQEEVQTLLASAAEMFPHDDCLTCECFLGYVTRLRIDAGTDSQEIFAQYQVERFNVHSCLGCDPCPPGDLYAQYVRMHKAPAPLITL